MTGRTLVVFDVCDTLFAANTTVGFLRHHQRRSGSKRLARALHRWVDQRGAGFLMGAVLYRLFRLDIARWNLVAALRGEPRAALSDSALDYVEHVLPGLANGLIHDRLEAHRAAGDHVILLSNSLDIVIAAVAQRLGVDFRASRLGFEDDLCTGRIVDDLSGRKSSLIRTLGGHGRLEVYTDNRSDRDLIALADRASIIVPRGRKPIRWAGEEYDYVEL